MGVTCETLETARSRKPEIATANTSVAKDVRMLGDVEHDSDRRHAGCGRQKNLHSE